MKDAIISHIPVQCPWADHIHVLDSIDSTNTKLKEMARAGAPEGTVVIARSQSGGRGRLGRSFHSPAHKGLYFSLLLRPQIPAFQLMHLTCAAGVAAINAVESLMGFRPGIKWINDLVVGKQKVGGILTELGLDSCGNAEYAVIGIGINCSHTRKDFPQELQEMATSLEACTGKVCDQSKLAAYLIRELYNISKDLISQKDQLLEAYKKDCITIGKQIQVIRDGQCQQATALDITGDGALLVRYENGCVCPVDSGEVSIRGMYGYIS